MTLASYLTSLGPSFLIRSPGRCRLQRGWVKGTHVSRWGVARTCTRESRKLWRKCNHRPKHTWQRLQGLRPGLAASL